MSDKYYTYVINNTQVLLPNSFNIRVFPCAYRGTYISSTDSNEYLFDPEARLNTERNLTLATTLGKDTYIASWNTDVTSPTLHCVINGYNIEIDNIKPADFDTIRTVSGSIKKPLYLYLIVKEQKLQETLTDNSCKTTIICPFSNIITTSDTQTATTGTVNSEVLDAKFSDDYYFLGAAFSTEELTTDITGITLYKLALLAEVTTTQKNTYLIPAESYYMLEFKNINIKKENIEDLGIPGDHYPGQIILSSTTPTADPKVYPTICIDTTKNALYYYTKENAEWRRIGAFWL